MITRGDIRKEWSWVRPGIENIKARNRADWLPEDIWCQVRTGQASLLINEERDSFAIICPTKDAYTGDHGIELVQLYCPDPGKKAALEEELFSMLKESGAVYMEAESKRKGFSRAGWDMHRIIYRRRL